MRTKLPGPVRSEFYTFSLVRSEKYPQPDESVVKLGNLNFAYLTFKMHIRHLE